MILSYILFPILFKKAADSPYKTKQQFWIYSFCVSLAFGYSLYAGKLSFSLTLLLIIAVGLVNSLAFYFHLRAVNISQSKSSVFSIGDDLIAIALGYIILNELQYLNYGLALGVLLCFLAAGLFIFGSRHELKKAKSFFSFVISYSVIWGLVAVLLRYYAFTGLPFSVFGFGWYFGSWIGSFFILSFVNKQEYAGQISSREIVNAFFMALFIWGALFLSYVALKYVPLSVFQPYFLISEMVFPTLVGLIIFKEIKKITPLETLAFLVGITGGIIITLNF